MMSDQLHRLLCCIHVHIHTAGNEYIKYSYRPYGMTKINTYLITFYPFYQNDIILIYRNVQQIYRLYRIIHIADITLKHIT